MKFHAQKKGLIYDFFILKVLEVECPPGKVVGYVEQNLNCYRPTYDICGPDGDAQYVIEGPSSCKTWCRSWTGKLCYLMARRKRCCCFGRDIVFNISHAESGEKMGEPKLMILKVHPSGRDLMKRLRAFWAMLMRPYIPIDPERSTRKMK